MQDDKIHPFQLGRTYIVAEIGKNFIDDPDDMAAVTKCLTKAKSIVYAAMEAGVDAVKFQTHHVVDEQLPLQVVSPHFDVDRYTWVTRNTEATPFDEFWSPLKEYCDSLGITFFSTPMSRGAARILEKLNVPFWKIASSDILDFVLLDYVAETGKMTILPSGMSTLEELDAAVHFLQSRGVPLTVLHAVSQYPYNPENSQLGTLRFLQKRYVDIEIGFSQNSPWIDPAVVAAAMGAVLLEQHVTLDRRAWGPDHKVSMIPEELSQVVQEIRRIESDKDRRDYYLNNARFEKFFGDEAKILQEGESIFRPVMRKALVAGADLPAGATLTKEVIYAMRPQGEIKGLPSERYEDVLGKALTKELKKYDPITIDGVSS